MNKILTHLGHMPVERFVRDYWQRKPLLIRQAWKTFTNPVTAAQLKQLAQREDVESRLITAFEGNWQVQYGPFGARQLPSSKRPDWTVLVQGVDLYEPAVAQLAQRFRFLPAARYDDVMISYATPNGGVGPHVDQYDVFLLQAQGRRRWRIARKPDTTLIDGLPLRILANFEPQDEWVLEPGDMLYLPPGVAHDGIALDESITISVGYRLPRLQELADTWADIQARDCPAEQRLADSVKTVASQAGYLPPELVEAAWRGLQALQPGPREAQRALLENLTEPKAMVCFESPEPALTEARFVREVERKGLQLDLRTRMLYAGKGSQRDVAINGECHALSQLAAGLPRNTAKALWHVLTGLADARYLNAQQVKLTQAAAAILYDWYLDGWLQVGRPDGA